VSITAADNDQMTACHCGMCRRWGGGPALAVHCGPDVDIVGVDNITTYASSAWAERGFCSRCGTHLFYRLVAGGDYILFAGFFGDSVAFHFSEQIFIDSKPDAYAFANVTVNLTEAEVFAKYAPPA
jgi:hypothetical protein